MNIIKAKTKDGKVVLLKCNQNAPAGTWKGWSWNDSPAAVKAAAVRRGLTLTGLRQR